MIMTMSIMTIRTITPTVTLTITNAAEAAGWIGSKTRSS